MGDYYSLRFEATVTPEAALAIQQFIDCQDWRGLRSDQDWVGMWAGTSRCNFIPNGALGYSPPGWENESSLDALVWRVCCSIKYDPMGAPYFLERILPQILKEPCTVEWWKELEGEVFLPTIYPTES